jgi:hypothetical protein
MKNVEVWTCCERCGVPSVRAVEIIGSLNENFKMRIGGFSNSATDVSENRLSVEIGDAPERGIAIAS